MLTAKIDTINFNKTMKNVVNYSEGFLSGVELERANFNKFLGGFTAEALGKYIDSKARMNSGELHHVYEPGETGNIGGRLFSFNVIATKSLININGKFLLSKKTPTNGGDPFINRAEIMENGIAITIVPKNGGMLAFEDGGEMVFTRKSIVIEHPGGDGVAGSFGAVVDDFFQNFFTGAMLNPILNKLSTPNDFTRNLAAGAVSGKPIGVRAGRQYLNMVGLTVE